jgi:FkbM family methyltransferase
VSGGRAVNRLLAPLGITLQRAAPARSSVERSLARLPGLGVAPRTVIDVGAAYGDWSAFAGKVFPAARFVLVDPLVEFAPFLERRARELGAGTVVPAAVGREPGTATLHVHADLVGTSLRAEPGLAESDREVAVKTIDGIVDDVGAEGPFVLKLDVQGMELEALEGATTTLAHTGLVQLETLLYPFYDGAPELADVVAFMRVAGFVVYDVLDLGYRPLDGALAQVDLLFAPEASGLRAQHVYATAEQRRAGDESLHSLYERRLRELER